MSIEAGLTFLVLAFGALAFIALRLIRSVAREIKRRKEEEQAQLLREYPELAEILQSSRGR